MSRHLASGYTPSADNALPAERTLRFTNVLSTLWETLRIWNARSRKRRALSRLAIDAHLLKDIGLTQGEALQEAAKPVWRP